MNRFDYRYLIALIAGLVPVLLSDPTLPLPSPFPYADMVILASIACMTYGGIFLVLPPPRTLFNRIAERMVGGTPEQNAATVRAIIAAQNDIGRIRNSADLLNGSLSEKIKDMADHAEKIIDEVAAAPCSLRRVRRLLDHYLPEFASVTERYVILSQKRESAGLSVDDALAKYEPVVQDMRALCDQQTERNLSRDAFKLDLDMDVLRKLIKVDGV